MKRIVSLLLTAVLLTAMLSVFVLPASAEGEVSKSENATWFENSKDPVWWELTEGRTKLTVGGKGNMPYYFAAVPELDKRPWKDYIETITTVVIDSGVENIGDFAFCGCTNLTSVTIPASVTSIEDSAFRDCKSLQRVTIPYGVNTIGANAFFGCKGLTSIVISSGVTRICSDAFRNCTSLQSVTIPSSVTSIDQNAFQGCTSLQSVTIPYGVTRINQNAFYGCANLQSVTIPPSVTRIDGFAFYGCTSLQSVTIPSSVQSIGNSAFNGCRKLASVTVKTSTPPTLGQMVFNGILGNLAIYVPCGSWTAYQQASGWSDKSGQIKEAYIVDDQPGENGTIMLDKDCFPVGNFAEEQTVTVSVVPDEGYQLQADSLTVSYKDGEEEKTVELTQDETDPTKYSFEMPKANVTLKAAFEAISDGTGSILSGGNLWIILGVVAAVLVAVIAALVVVKKKGNE